MAPQTIAITTPNGSIPCLFFPQPTPKSAVILYMDAFGIRPALVAMAQRLADNAEGGYTVLLPNLYYRAGNIAPFNPATAFKDPAEKERLAAARKPVTNTSVMHDTAACLDFLDQNPASKNQPVGTVGYCMGGALALSAAGTFPDRIKAAASFHGARLATDQPDSPHLLAPAMKAHIYVGIAAIDPHFTPEEKARLQTALQSSKVPHTLETYENAHHGFAIPDHPVYNPQAADHHWQQLLTLFADNLRSAV
jgi:carboxymethylenebutenolidase